MQHIDHDMDDLFRKAAEGYPLKTGEDDWDKLAAKIEFAPAVTAETAKKRSKRYILWFVALVICMFLGGLFYYNIPGHLGKQKTAFHKHETDSEKRGSLKKPAGIASAERNGLPESLPVKDKKAMISERNNNGSRQNLLLSTNVTFKNSRRHDNDILIAGDERSINYMPSGDSPTPELAMSTNILKSSLVKNAQFDLSYSINAPEIKSVVIKIAAFQSQHQKRFYIGLNGGPEFSKVGSQANTKTGYHAGFLAGYKFNSKWSVESGVLIGENNYYSNGSYFNMSKVSSSMPAGMEILTVDGQSKHVEIPVVAKYNFVHLKRSDLFFTGGIISDLYLQEKNYYQTMLNGIKDNQMGLYTQNHFSLASQLRISIGYEHPFGRSGIFRIEPYKNVPLQKSGMGSMSVFSSGFNVGLVRFFGR